MDGHRRRKVHTVEIDGATRNAYSTSITYSLTLEDLMHAIAVAATTPSSTRRRFKASLAHNPVARESYWSEKDTAEAHTVAATLGPGLIYSTARAELRANGEGWRTSHWSEIFPEEAARRRAEELFPMLRNEGNPFAPAPPVADL